MQIKLFTMVKDESDIVVDWVFYHGSIFGFKNLYIIDNYSTDGTYEKLLKLKPMGIHLSRKHNYWKKGEYMTWYYNNCCAPEDIAYPIDIDEFIVHYDKKENKISTNKHSILNYLHNLPNSVLYKTNYIHAMPNQEAPNGFTRASAECSRGLYESYNNYAKSFMKKEFYNGPIDHGNHIPVNNYYMTDLCLVHFHTRNLEQFKKKIYNNVKGFDYPVDNPTKLRELLQSDPNCAGNHHVKNQIKVLENTLQLPCHHYSPGGGVDLTPLNDFIKQIEHK